MISSIFGISRVVNSIRAGTDIRPMIGPSTSPRKRSMIVHAAPNATWKNVSGQSLLTAIATIRATSTIATSTRPARGTIWKSGTATRGGGAVASASCDGAGIATSVIWPILFSAAG